MLDIGFVKGFILTFSFESLSFSLISACMCRNIFAIENIIYGIIVQWNMSIGRR